MTCNWSKVLDNTLAWTPEAEERLLRVPEGVSRELTRQPLHPLPRQRGQTTVTRQRVETKYHQWAEGSAQAASAMTWTEEAQARMERIPDFVRGMVAKAIESYAQEQGLTEITPNILEEAKGFWENTGGFINREPSHALKGG